MGIGNYIVLQVTLTHATAVVPGLPLFKETARD